MNKFVFVGLLAFYSYGSGEHPQAPALPSEAQLDCATSRALNSNVGVSESLRIKDAVNKCILAGAPGPVRYPEAAILITGAGMVSKLDEQRVILEEATVRRIRMCRDGSREENRFATACPRDMRRLSF